MDEQTGYAQCERCLFRFKIRALAWIPGSGYHCQACCMALSDCDGRAISTAAEGGQGS